MQPVILSTALTCGLKRGLETIRINCDVEISAVLHYAIVQQLTFFTFVCITQLFLALWYTYYEHALGDVQFQSQRKNN